MKKTSGGTLAVGLVERGADWELSFSDTGPGLNSQQTEKIFEPFQSGFEGGTGLGLAIVYQVVQAHEGKVWARSESGKGTSFVVRLRKMEEEEVPIPSGIVHNAATKAATAGGGTLG
jgi:signal transduction histidine kinase